MTSPTTDLAPLRIGHLTQVTQKAVFSKAAPFPVKSYDFKNFAKEKFTNSKVRQVESSDL